MPTRKVPCPRGSKAKSCYRWGKHGKVYGSKAKADAQGRAAYAHGYRGKGG